jgi:hypothetical protein
MHQLFTVRNDVLWVDEFDQIQMGGLRRVDRHLA